MRRWRQHRAQRTWAAVSHAPKRWVRRKLNEAFTAAEVARHCTPDDCWLIIKGNVYDVSGWGESHPGGKVIYTYGGRVRCRCTRSPKPRRSPVPRPQDATDVFSAFHAGATWQLLRARQIGACSDVSPELLQDFRRLRAEMQAAKLFQSNKLYYAWKCSSNLAICAASLSILRSSSSFTAVFAAAFLMVRHQPTAHMQPSPPLTATVRRRCSGSSAAGWPTTSCTIRCDCPRADVRAVY